MVHDLPLGVDCMIESGCLPLPECFDLTVDHEVLGNLLVPQPEELIHVVGGRLVRPVVLPKMYGYAVFVLTDVHSVAHAEGT